MAKQERPVDPYAAPHAPKEKSGPVLRAGIVAVLLGGAALGWGYYASQPQESLTPSLTEQEAAADQPIQVAESAAAQPEAIPIPQAEPAPQAAPAPQRSAPAPRTTAPAPAPVENVPPPSTTIAPAPAPVQQM